MIKENAMKDMKGGKKVAQVADDDEDDDEVKTVGFYYD
jgi:hypothetical protein